MSLSVEALPPPPSPDTYDRYFGVRRLWQTKPSNSRRLFPFEGIFDAADGVRNLALDLVGLVLRLQLCVTDRVADRLFYRAFDLLSRSDDAILVHDFLLKDCDARNRNGHDEPCSIPACGDNAKRTGSHR
jgi:hypothetical protein